MRKHVALREQDDEHYELPVEEAIELARAHHIAGNYVLAERTYHDVLKVTPDNPTTNHLLGALYYQVGNIEKALYFMKASIDIEPNEKQYWSNYGSVFYMSEKNEDAIRCYNEALALDPDHVETLNRKSLAFWKQEKFDDAKALALKSLKNAPDNLDGLVNLALCLTKQADYTEASKIWEKAHALYPNDVRILSNWANMLRELYQFKKAEIVALKALEIDPNDTETLNNYGCILRDMGQHAEAIEIFEKTTDIRPKNYQAHYNKSLAYNDLGMHREAAIAARYAVDFKEDYAPGYNALSSALVEIGEFNQAHYAAQRALQIDPENPESYLNLADVLYLANCFDDGHAALKEALKRDPENARSYSKLSSIYERLDEADDALWAIDKAIELAPNTPLFLARKASILHISNHVEEALEQVNQALEISPDLMPALITKAEILIAINDVEEAKKVLDDAKKVNPDHPLIFFTTSSIKKFETEDDEDFQKMLSIKDDVAKMGTTFSSSLDYAIAKGYETQKQYEKAFEYLDRANHEKRQTLPYDEKKQPEVFQKIKEEFSPELIRAFTGKGYSSDKPIFIVGMPRSGTTLTEQIISSHPDVFGAGELPDVMRTKRRMGSITPDNLKEAGELYLELSSARDKSGKAKRITDKMPGNYMNLGLIATMLPDAKIIHCCRSPMDTCLSNYKQNFMVGQYWSYDLEEMGAEYLRYLDLMEYWHKSFPGRILDINYEDTVNDLESQARKLIDYVGLEWNEACLEPHKQKRSVLTASKSQVTQPVYKTSVEKWRRYESQMKPLADILGIKTTASDEAKPPPQKT